MNNGEASQPFSGNILAVDDTAANLDLIVNILRQRDYHVRSFSEGPRAIKSAIHRPPDLALLDINMPDMDGYEVCRQLKAHAVTQDIPVIFISALDETLDKVKAFSVGGVDYITKPFQAEEMLARVQTHMTLRKLQQELQQTNQRLHESNAQLRDEMAERKRVEKMVNQTKIHLINQAYEAGMAEMASDMLHNISNVLTPAKITALKLQEYLQNHPLHSHLQKLSDILLHSKTLLENAPSTITDEEKVTLFGLVDLLPGNIQETFDDVLDKVGCIIDRHFAIEDMIHLQRRYEKEHAPRWYSFNLLIKDVLSMLDAPIKRLAVRVMTEFEELPFLHGEDVKVLQLLLNVLRNSCEAMSETPREERRLVVTTTLENDQNVVLTVSDTGKGFSAEEKERLFHWDFSTKKKRSGFGLQACANFLIAHHGQIHAQSPGKGKGAVFTIRLPIDHQ